MKPTTFDAPRSQQRRQPPSRDRRRATPLVVAAILAVASTATAQSSHDTPDSNWPSFRGAFARGVADGQPTSSEWHVPSGTNVAWSTALPGLAHSSPVVWGDRVFVTTAVRVGAESELIVGLYGSPTPVDAEGLHKFQLYCLDKITGEIVWVRTAIETVPKYQRHPKGSYAASSPVTDGEHVVACFASEGLFGYDMDGQLLWSKDLGDLNSGWYMAPGAEFGFASSPVIHDGRLLLQVDVQEGSSLWAMNVADGSDLWRTTRADVPSWSTPTVDVEDGRSQVIVNGFKHMGGYDLETGEELWKLSGGGDVPVPTPIVHDGLVFITNGHGRWNPIYAIDAAAEGEIADGFSPENEPFVAWSQSRRGTYMQTPILYRGLLYACTDAGILSCFDPVTGERFGRARLGDGRSGFTASPVAADGKLYFTSEEGAIHVVEAGTEMNVLAVNEMGQVCMATPAISEGTIFFRTQTRLVAVAGAAPVTDETRIAHAADDTEPKVPTDPEPVAAAEIAGAPLPEAVGLFERHLEARGGVDALARYETIETTGSFSMPSIGMKGSMVQSYTLAGLYLSVLNLGAMGMTRQGFDGKTGWIDDPSIGKEILRGDLLAQLKSDGDWMADARYLDRYRSMTTTRRVDHHGFDCFEVEVETIQSGSKSKIYFEVETGLLRGSDAISVTAGGPMRIVTVFKKYREFDGIEIATESEFVIPEHRITQVITVDEVAFDTLDESTFELPPEIREKLGGQ